MKQSIDELIEIARAKNSWCQPCNITDHPDGQEGSPDCDEEDIESITYDASCSAGDKDVAHTPVEALHQPMLYPRNALYRLPLRFRYIESLSDLISYLKSQAVSPGCRLACNGGRNGSPQPEKQTSSSRFCTVNLYCPKYFVSADNSHLFEPENYAMSNIVKERVKSSKSKGDRNRGIRNMYSKGAKKTIPPARGPVLDKQEKNKRTSSNRSEEKDRRCYVHLIVFGCTRDGYFYLSRFSNFRHTDHPYIEPSVMKRSVKEFTDQETNYMSELYDDGFTAAQIARIMTRMKGASMGMFLPKTLYNMNRKTQAMFDLAKGISPDMSDAQKTLASIEA